MAFGLAAPKRHDYYLAGASQGEMGIRGPANAQGVQSEASAADDGTVDIDIDEGALR